MRKQLLNADDTIAQLISTLNVHLSSANRQNSVTSVCQSNITVVWFNANATNPFPGLKLPSSATAQEEEQQLQAVLYIVVVLMFYSITIAAAMIKYMYQESQQATEGQTYQDFLVRTKQLALEQTKKDFARRVSIQLVAMSHTFNGRQSTVASSRRLSALPALEESDADAEREDDQSFDARKVISENRRVMTLVPPGYGGSVEAMSASDDCRVSTASDCHSWSTTLDCPSGRSPSITPSEMKSFADSLQKLSVL